MARLVEENRGLRHRLSKYEASPKQARYKFARETAAAKAAIASTSVEREARKHGSATAALTAAAAAARKQEAEEAEARKARTAQSGDSGNSAVSCLNSCESAAFADRVLLF